MLSKSFLDGLHHSTVLVMNLEEDERLIMCSAALLSSSADASTYFQMETPSSALFCLFCTFCLTFSFEAF